MLTRMKIIDEQKKLKSIRENTVAGDDFGTDDIGYEILVTYFHFKTRVTTTYEELKYLIKIFSCNSRFRRISCLPR